MKVRHSFKKLVSVFISLTFMAALIPQSTLADGPDPQQSLTGISVSDTKDSVNSVYELADSLYQRNSNFGRRAGGFIWDTEGKKRSWTYYNGIMMDAFLTIDKEAYLPCVNDYYNENITSSGKVDSTDASENYYREKELDSIPPARALFDLIREKDYNKCADKYKKTINYIYSIMQSYEVAEGTNGNFKHKIDNKNWETYLIALDGLYMAQPFFMEVANALDDGILIVQDFQTYTCEVPESDDIYSAVTERMLWIGENLYIPQKHLYCHGWGPDGLNGQYWLRAVGWYAAALADVISMLPKDGYEEEKDALILTEKKLFDGMLEYRDEATGMWYNVIDHGPELAGSGCNNELETSGTALMAYAMMKTYAEGYLDDTYGEAGLMAFNGIVKNYLDSEGLHNVYISSGVETTPEGYLGKSYKVNEAKGVGPLMMAASYANAAAEIHAAPSAILTGGEDMTFEINKTPDFSGVSANIIYNNGTSVTVTSEKLTFGECDPTVTGLQEVEVYYKDINCGKIRVTFKEPDSEDKPGSSSSSSRTSSSSSSSRTSSSSSSTRTSSSSSSTRDSSSSSSTRDSSSSSSSRTSSSSSSTRDSSSSSSTRTSSSSSSTRDSSSSSSAKDGSSSSTEKDKDSSSSIVADRKDSSSSSVVPSGTSGDGDEKDSTSGSVKVVSEPTQPVSVSIGGTPVQVRVEQEYTADTVYSGEALTPESAGLKTDVSGLEGLAKTAIENSAGNVASAGDLSGLFTVSYKAKGKGGAGETAFTSKIKFDKKQAKQLGMSKDDIKALANAVKALNKFLKQNPAKIQVAKADLAKCFESIDASFDAKGKLKINSVTVKLNEKTVTLKKKDYKVTVSDSEKRTVTLEGRKNYEGTITVTLK